MISAGSLTWWILFCVGFGGAMAIFMDRAVYAERWTIRWVIAVCLCVSLAASMWMAAYVDPGDGEAGTVYETRQSSGCRRVMFIDKKGRKGKACVPNDQRSRYPVGSQYPQGAPW